MKRGHDDLNDITCHVCDPGPKISTAPLPPASNNERQMPPLNERQEGDDDTVAAALATEDGDEIDESAEELLEKEGQQEENKNTTQVKNENPKILNDEDGRKLKGKPKQFNGKFGKTRRCLSH